MKDVFLQKIIKAAAPSDIRIDIYNIENGVCELKKEAEIKNELLFCKDSTGGWLIDEVFCWKKWFWKCLIAMYQQWRRNRVWQRIIYRRRHDKRIGKEKYYEYFTGCFTGDYLGIARSLQDRWLFCYRPLVSGCLTGWFLVIPHRN